MTLTVGGAARGTYDTLTSTFFDTYYPQLARYIRRYNLDGMDLDVEQVSYLTHISTPFFDTLKVRQT
jgi:chitinase